MDTLYNVPAPKREKNNGTQGPRCEDYSYEDVKSHAKLRVIRSYQTEGDHILLMNGLVKFQVKVGYNMLTGQGSLCKLRCKSYIIDQYNLIK